MAGFTLGGGGAGLSAHDADYHSDVTAAGSTAGSLLSWDGSSAYNDTSRALALGTTTAVGALLSNTTAATVGAQQQYSSAMQWLGCGWITDSGGSSQTVGWRSYVKPGTGSTAAAPTLVFEYRTTTAGSWTEGAQMTSSGDFKAPGGITAGSGLAAGIVSMGTKGRVFSQTNVGSGLSTTGGIESTSNPGVCFVKSLTDGAAVRAWATAWYTLSATAPAGKLHSFGWVNNGGAFVESAYIAGNGDIVCNGGLGNGQALGIKALTTLHTLADATSSHSTGLNIPAGCLCLAVSTRVVTAIPSAGGVTYDVGIGGATTRYASGLSDAADTTDSGNDDGVRGYDAATEIILTTSGNTNAGTGQVRVTIHYIELTPPTS